MTQARSRVGFSRRTIVLSHINILPQHRIHFPDDLLEALAESLWHDGMFARPIVARLSRAQATALLEVKNRLKRDGAPFALEDLVHTPEDPEHFDVLIAGERRVRAARLLRKHPEFAVRNGRETSPLAQTFRRALRHDTITVELAEGDWLDPERFLQLQNKENSYHPPSIEEMAAGYRSWYDQLLLTAPGLTISAFAKKVGRTPETVRSYFAYLEVDPDVRVRFKKVSGKSSLAQVLEYARLARVARGLEERRVSDARDKAQGLLTPAREEEIRRECQSGAQAFGQTLLVEIEVHAYSASRIRKEIDQWRDAQVSPQIGLFAKQEEEAGRTHSALRRHRANAIDARLTSSLSLFQKFVVRVTERFERGELGLPTSPFASFAVIQAVLALHRLLLTLLPIIRKHLEHPDWNGRHRPVSPKKIKAAEDALRAEEVGLLLLCAEEGENEKEE